MKVSEKIKKRILKMPAGITFKYQQLKVEAIEYSAATKVIERLIKKGLIARASTGVFYKPKKTGFGNLKPNEEELLKPYLFEDNKRVAYITGPSLYNKMGLTTQVPKNIKVASRNKRIATKLGSVQVKPVKSYVDVTDGNYYLMELLDILKDYKTIPDSDKVQVIKFVLRKIKELSKIEKEQLIKIAIKYPPRVRAFLGALITELNYNAATIDLKKSINPLTTFKLGITPDQLSTIRFWNIH